MKKLLLPCRIPTAPNAFQKIKLVQAQGREIAKNASNPADRYDLTKITPLMEHRTQKLESAAAAVGRSLSNEFTPNNTYHEGFDHVARYLYELFDNQGMPGVTLPASRILEATDPVYYASEPFQLRFSFELMKIEAAESAFRGDG